MAGHYHKRDGQVYVQTWHGTPLKKIGFDITQPQFISGAGYFEVLAADVAKLGPAAVAQPVQHVDHAPGVPL